jgi:hypothetical protein
MIERIFHESRRSRGRGELNINFKNYKHSIFSELKNIQQFLVKRPLLRKPISLGKAKFPRIAKPRK